MYICYLDESGTTDAGDASGHFVLVGLAILAQAWKSKDAQVDEVKAGFGLAGEEIHTAWMLREYPEQNRIAGFAALDRAERRRRVLAIRAENLARPRMRKQQNALVLSYRKTAAYLHLTRDERRHCLQRLADLIGSWTDARLFAEAQKKCALPNGAGDFDEAFEQVVTRFNTCLRNIGGVHGILVQDNNETVAVRLTKQMRRFHREGTTWARAIEFVVETPMFVDSELTSMVQLADLCAYALRRFFDNGECDLLDRISPAFDRKANKLVGLRHYTRADACTCKLCIEHGRRPARTATPVLA